MVVRSAAPLATMKKKVGEEAWAGLRARVLEALRKRLPDGGADLSAEAILTSGALSGAERCARGALQRSYRRCGPRPISPARETHAPARS